MSGATIPYHLRQNKFVERALFLDILTHVNRYPDARIAEYLYVGFGGAYLEDFKVIHGSFGNRKMLSLEKLPWIRSRQEFNIPYGCVECSPDDSAAFISNYADILSRYGNPNALIWLDYSIAKDLRLQLTEFETLVAKLKRLDIVKITLNAQPSTLGGGSDEEDPSETTTADEKRNKRLVVLKDRAGDYAPTDITADDLQKPAYPRVLQRAIWKAGTNGMMGSPHLILHPIASYSYEDGQQMLTVTCIVLGNHECEHFLGATTLNNFEFATNNWDDIIRIDIPYLSTREKLYLDTLVHKATLKNDPRRLRPSASLKVTLGKTPGTTRSLAESYLRFYRYYPHFHRIHY